MGCVVVSEYSNSVIGKGEVNLKSAVKCVVNSLNFYLESKGLSKRFKILLQDNLDFQTIRRYRMQRCKERRFNKAYVNNSSDLCLKNSVKPDGGIVWLQDIKSLNTYPILVSEMKYQGTNKNRAKAGKKAQARGNANERAGKYSMLFRTLWELDDILPYAVFHSGCDYALDSDGGITGGTKTQYSKLESMNSLFPVNVVYTRKNMPVCRRLLPHTTMVQEDYWSVQEIRNILYTIGEDSLNYYLEFLV